jgi:hypothetical protein
MFKTSRDYEELDHYWTSWHDAMTGKILVHFTLRLRQLTKYIELCY